MPIPEPFGLVDFAHTLKNGPIIPIFRSGVVAAVRSHPGWMEPLDERIETGGNILRWSQPVAATFGDEWGAWTALAQMKALYSGEQDRGNTQSLLASPDEAMAVAVLAFCCDLIEFSTRQVASRGLGEGDVPEWYGCCLYGHNRWRGLWPAQVLQDYDTEMFLTSRRLQTTICLSPAKKKKKLMRVCMV